MGVRAEQWKHFDSKGQSIAKFDWELDHRFNISYDLFGDGKTKLWYFNGQYNDPIRTNMTFFVGNVTGSSYHDQLFVNNHWLTFRHRGGSESSSGVFAPNIKSPTTSEQLLGLKSVLTDDTSIELTYSKRKTTRLIEDYSPNLYSKQLSNTDFYLPPSYFGVKSNNYPSYVMANLVGGQRNYEGFEIIFNKQRTTDWNFSASYTYGDAEGNSNSDSSVDFQGDFVWLDPRAPNMYGRLPGSIQHLFKAYGTYFFNNGIEMGFVYQWNSGTNYNKTWRFANRHLPVLSSSIQNIGGVSSKWVSSDAIGTYQTPSYGIVDLRLKYKTDCSSYTCEAFIDIFNIFDNQAVSQEQGLATGDGNFEFGMPINWQQPRRFYLGVRLSF